ncbi:RNA recognition motif-containing protein [Phytophthora infestans]|uniref:RNA recognition motif-containing protein n=1 Tax=Phytophthora infestans TaxID=4787 RepID=A0A8S9UX98_PHYIN|nr:RNA recognition motif-containing protein [Phytophthora infestans]
MDLYADLPLAKGAKASSALDADGKPKASLSSTSSVWASTPLMVPQAAKNKNNSRPTSVTTSSMSMLPAALAAGRGKSPTRSAISLAFKPASVARRATASSQVIQKKQEHKQETPRPAGRGLGYVAATEVKVTSVQQAQNQEKEDLEMGLGAGGGHFFQVTYRDEYHPTRPNSYEVYCKEREDRKKMDIVKKELSRRQREQEREGKLEREQLAKDLADGRAPAMKLPVSAGRGRGMTMPAWMRKKIEENAAVAASQPESEHDGDRECESKSSDVNAAATEGQFEDAAESRGGLGFFNRGIGFSSSRTSPGREATNAKHRGNTESGGHRKDRDTTERLHSQRPELDEFGREIRPKRKQEDQRHEDRRDSRNERPLSMEKRRKTSGWDSKSPARASSTSRVVLLQNMVGPGEVDDELQEEVKEECSEKYGPVTRCVIYEVTGRVSPEEAVRIFVQFRDTEDATKALMGLHGRFFGGRKVKAEYFDEAKFGRMNLNSQ